MISLYTRTLGRKDSFSTMAIHHAGSNTDSSLATRTESSQIRLYVLYPSPHGKNAVPNKKTSPGIGFSLPPQGGQNLAESLRPSKHVYVRIGCIYYTVSTVCAPSVAEDRSINQSTDRSALHDTYVHYCNTACNAVAVVSALQLLVEYCATAMYI